MLRSVSRNWLKTPDVVGPATRAICVGVPQEQQWCHRKLFDSGMVLHNAIILKSLCLRLAEPRLKGWRWMATMRQLSKLRLWTIFFLIMKIQTLVVVSKQSLVMDRIRVATHDAVP